MCSTRSQLSCSDAASLARFSPATIAVSLLQRTLVTAQGLSESSRTCFRRRDSLHARRSLIVKFENYTANTHDKIVLHAERVVAIGGTTGRPVRGRDGVEAYEIIYSGALKMVSCCRSALYHRFSGRYLLALALVRAASTSDYHASLRRCRHLRLPFVRRTSKLPTCSASPSSMSPQSPPRPCLN